MAVSIKRTRESTTALVQQVGQHCLVVSVNTSLLDFQKMLPFAYMIFSKSRCCEMMRVIFCSGGMTRRQPPTFCCCQRSRGANLSVCALNQQSVRTLALPCIKDYRSLQMSLVSLVLTAASLLNGFHSRLFT